MKNNNCFFYSSPQMLASSEKNSTVLLALAGGADSSALLHLLNEDAQRNGFVLHAAHFNHQIRGEEAKRDAEFCRRACDKLNIPFHLGTADIPALAKESGNGIEAEAREQRYAFFERIMKENGIQILVTAHHAEDQIESIMLHILRGSGIAGAVGMREVRELSNGLLLVRPILRAEKQDILDYCEQNNIKFVTDSTNEDTNYLRNAIRADITPRMRELQPKLCEVFSRFAESAREADDYISTHAREFVENECENGISIKKLLSLHEALRPRVLALEFKKISDSGLEKVHVNALLSLCEKAEPHSSISLPSGVCARIENECLLFTRNVPSFEKTDFYIPFAEGAFALPCEDSNSPTHAHARTIIINIEKNPVDNAQKSPFSLDVKSNLLDAEAHLRPRREGDVIFTDKMNKKAKKLISEKKIPLEMRNILPILVSKNEILWIPSVAVCDKVKTDKIKEGEDFFRITVKFAN